MDEITVLVLGDPAEPALGLLSALGPGVHVRIGTTASAFGPDLAKARVLFHWAGPKEEARRILAGASRLEWMHGRYAGLDHILFPELIASPIVLTNGSGVFSQSLGEFAMLGALYFAKDVPRLLRAKAKHMWEQFESAEIRKQTLGIVGYGDIGRHVAWRAKALGMRVLALRRDPSPRAGDEHVDKIYANSQLHEMLPECDYVVVAAPLTPQTKGLMSTREFECMKDDAVVMNLGRGPVIDEAAMIAALQNGTIRGAALDVFEMEPLPESSPLWSMDNVLLSPHTTDRTKDWLADAVVFFMEQFARWQKGEKLHNIVDKEAGY